MTVVTSYPEHQTLPPPNDPSEGRLLLQEAREYMIEAVPSEKGQAAHEGKGKRAESKKPCKGYTGERLFREEPRRYKLIASMLAEGTVPLRAIMRTCLCDRRTVASVQRREAESMPAIRQKLTRRYGRIAAMTAERLEEEIPNMNHSTLAVCSGIATDKFLTLNGDPTARIDVNVNDPRGNIFDRMAALHAELHQAAEKIVKARIIEQDTPALTNG